MERGGGEEVGRGMILLAQSSVHIALFWWVAVGISFRQNAGALD